MNVPKPSFNLWTEPWITLETPDGSLRELSLEKTLKHAHELRAIYDPSPLVIASIHRLLTAIVHDIIRPARDEDLAEVWKAERYAESEIHLFGERYAHRFDLFSRETPFLQSADLPLEPEKRAPGMKPVSYLIEEIPAGTEVAHYRHGVADDYVFCPVCAARGLVTIPAFATSGGAGIK
ncbi:MAG: type I-E CRISPR-associated protein Cse1/CasA, partial [Anaerolineae bacterium]